MPTPGSNGGNGTAPYRLPGPLSKRGELPVAPSAPRIPRALRAFNGMPPEESAPESPAVAPVVPPAVPLRGARPREPLTIRDLLEEPAEEVEERRLAGLRTALRRLRKGWGTPED